MSGDLVERLQALARAKHDDLSVANEAADLIEAQAGEIERLRGDLANERCVVTAQSEARVAAESELSTLRARVREVVRPFAKAGELFSPRLPDEYDQCIYSPAAGDEYSLCGDHLRAARQLMEEVK